MPRLLPPQNPKLRSLTRSSTSRCPSRISPPNSFPTISSVTTSATPPRPPTPKRRSRPGPHLLGLAGEGTRPTAHTVGGPPRRPTGHGLAARQAPAFIKRGKQKDRQRVVEVLESRVRGHVDPFHP